MRVGFCGLLTIVFITLKLTNVIYWSWLWVLSPMWIPIAVVCVFYAFIFIIAALDSLFDELTFWRNK